MRRPSLRAGVAGAGSSRPARPNPFIAPLPRSPSAARRRLCTFLLGRRARSGSGGAGGGSFAVCPEAGDAPAPPPPEGLRLTRAGPGPGPLALETWALGSPRGPRAGVGIPARTRCREEAKGDLGSDRRRPWGQNSRLSFEEVSLVEKSLFLRVRRAVSGSSAGGNEGGPRSQAAATRLRH